MSTNLTPEQILDDAIAFGRARVRIIESAEYLLTRSPSFVEGVILRLALTMSRHILRRLVAELPPVIAAKILAGSDKMTGPVRGFAQN